MRVCIFMIKKVYLTSPDSVIVRASASGVGDRGFDPGPRHTKDDKNCTSGYHNSE